MTTKKIKYNLTVDPHYDRRVFITIKTSDIKINNIDEDGYADITMTARGTDDYIGAIEITAKNNMLVDEFDKMEWFEFLNNNIDEERIGK